MSINVNVPLNSSQNRKYFGHKNTENQNENLCSFFFKSCHLGDNVKKYGTAREVTKDNTVRCMHFACWIIKATDILSEYAILTAFPRQQLLSERNSLLNYSTLPVLFPLNAGFDMNLS